MEKKRLFIMGFPKCGTSSLFETLTRHKAISGCSKKEPHFFMDSEQVLNFKGKGDEVWHNMTVTRQEDYNRLFKLTPQTQFLMDGSTNHIYSRSALDKIRAKYKNVKIIVSLRDPIERAYSAWMHLKSAEREGLNFYDALKEEEQRVQDNYEFLWRYKSCGQYEKWILQLLEVFPMNSVMFIKSNEIRDRDCVFNKCMEFLGLNEDDIMDKGEIPSRNEGGFIKNRFFHKLQTSNALVLIFIKSIIPNLLKKKLRRINYEKPKISQFDKDYLFKYYQQTYEEVKKITGINLYNE